MAAKQFDVFVTVDQSIDFQNNLAQIPIAVVILVALNNMRNTLFPLVLRVIEMLPELVVGTATRVEG